MFKQQPEYETERNEGSLKTLCCTLQRWIQKYLACERYCQNYPVSGETSEDFKVRVMRLYRARTKITDKATGNERDGPSLRSLEAVQVLRHIPKFSGTVEVAEDKEEVKMKQEMKALNPVLSVRLELRNTSKHLKHLQRRFLRLLSANLSAVQEKVYVKKSELRFKCIKELPDGEKRPSYY